MSEVKLVPARMLLDKETIGAINFHCGDGNVCGECCDGILWVGTVTDDDGAAVYGLHLQTAEYPEEGSTTLVEFDEPVSDFDAKRLRADTAEACLEEWRRSNHGKTVLENLDLREKLAAAEQRIAELLVMLRQAWVDECVSAADCRKIDAALNPNPEAESHE